MATTEAHASDRELEATATVKGQAGLDEGEAPASSEAMGRWEIDDEGIATVFLDEPGSKVNTLSRALASWLAETMKTLDRDDRVKAVLLTSAKKDNFVAGANIEEMRAMESRDELAEMVRAANAFLDELEAMSTPVVAAIDGSCLGGGLELAMATHRRIASSNPKTKIGLPEVQLGLFPAAGGTYRLPRLVGLEKALDLILTGKQLDARRARKAGLVDEVVHPADLLAAARRHAAKMAAERQGKGFVRRLSSTLGEMVPSSFDDVKERVLEAGPVRSFIFKQARERVQKKTGGHYPAPLVALDMVDKGLSLSRQASFDAVAEAFADLATTDVARNLMTLFFLRNDALKTRGGIEGDLDPRPVRHLGVLGAGLMGAGISQVAAYKDIVVRMKDVDLAAAGRGLKYCRDRFDELVERRKLTPVQRDLYMGNISAGTTYEGFELVDFVVEAVFEDLELKRQVLRDVEERLADDAVFASNTSSLPIGDIAEAARRPERVVGMHFFSPVHKMPLVEIIRAPKTNDQTVLDTIGLAKAMGKVPIVVNDCPGFFTTRALGPYMNEAAYLLQEGGDIAEIDRALVAFGFPVGPVTLMDEVGLDVGAKVGEILHKAYGDRMKPPASLVRVVEDGRKGRKNGRGFYLYSGDQKGGVDESVYDVLPGGRKRRSLPQREIQDRCWLALLNECARCLDEGIVPDPATIDIGVIFGFGFPPFLGGVCRYADKLGAATVVARLRAFEERFGPRFEPARCLVDMAESGGRFFTS